MKERRGTGMYSDDDDDDDIDVKISLNSINPQNLKRDVIFDQETQEFVTLRPWPGDLSDKESRSSIDGRKSNKTYFFSIKTIILMNLDNNHV